MGDVTFSAAALAIITGLLAALSGVIAALFRLLIASKDATLDDMTNQRDSYQKMAANRARRARGEAPFQPIPPVVPEHNSPTTPEQIASAEYETLKARAARAARILSIPLEALSEEAMPPVDFIEAVATDLSPALRPSIDVAEPIVLHPGETATVIAVPSASEAVPRPTSTSEPPSTDDSH